jgi:glycosyltransferase involved in cell wall biosynthesis
MKKLNINCPIGKTGYGITSLNILKELYKLDLNISLFPIGGGNQIELNSEDEKPILQNTFNNSQSFDHLSPCLKIWHQFDLANRIGSGHYYSFPFFEVDKLKPIEKTHLNSCDGIFVASKWGKSILEQNDITKPIYVAPLAVDSNLFKIPTKIKVDNNYIFFHIGKWEHRKSHDFLIQTFNEAFNSDDNVELWLLPHNMFLKAEQEQYWINMVKNSKLANKIKIFDRLPTQYHLVEFIFRGDCGVFLSRAEGWNNSILESMALNKPIIATNYSAHTEYCTKDNSYLVDITQTEIANDGNWFHGEGSWAKLGQQQLDQSVELMRFVYNNNIRTNPNGLKTAKQFSWDKTASIIHQALTRNNSYYANSRKKPKRR